MISSVTGNKTCVSNIADSNVLQYLLLVLHMLPSCKYMNYRVCINYSLIANPLVLEVLQALTSHTQIVKESVQKGINTCY